MTEVEVDAAGDGDGDGRWDRDGTDDRVDVHVRACARRLVDGLQYGDDYMLVMMMMMLLLIVAVMSAGPCGDARVNLHFHVRVNRDDNVWTEMR